MPPSPSPIPLGMAPDSWGIWYPNDPKQMPWTRMLDEMAAIGLEWIELGPYGYLPTEETVLRAALHSRGLKICACCVEGNLEDPANWPNLEHQLLGGGGLAAAFGAEFLILIDDDYSGSPTATARLNESDWQRLVHTTQRIAQTARERFGLYTVFHPNSYTHVEHEDQIERLLAETNPELVGLCLDTGHVAYRNVDPVALYRRFHERIPHIHLKSVSAQVRDRAIAEGLTCAQAVGQGAFCEPAGGIVDFQALYNAMQELDYGGRAIIEQDMYPVAYDKPMGIAQQSRAYYEKIGFGEETAPT